MLESPLRSNIKIGLRKISVGEDENIKDVLLEVKQSGVTHIVLDCDQENIGKVLIKAQEVGLVNAYHSFLITSLDLHLVDLEGFKDSGVNITSLRLVDPMLPKMIDTVKAWEKVNIISWSTILELVVRVRKSILYYFRVERILSIIVQPTEVTS